MIVESHTTHALSAESQWAIWNERLNTIESRMKEARLYSCVFVVVVLFATIFSKSQEFGTTFTLGVSGLTWGMTFVFSLLGEYRTTPLEFRHIEKDLNEEALYLFIKEIEESYYARARRYRTVIMLVMLSMLYTISAIFLYLF